jgi:hypothetical protein
MTRLRVATVACVVFALLGLGAPAHAQDPPTQPRSDSSSTHYQVTFVARACTQYPEIMGNKVRDDTAESPAWPGRDNVYDEGRGVDPDVEAANSNGCSTLDGWRFTLGGGEARRSPLSVVTGPLQEVGPTADGAARLDANGRPTGQTIDGAVTVALTAEQVKAATSRQLWAQGGTPDDPLLAATQPGYGFGVLRCGYDGRAGTNVQWVGFPAEVRHVFCFAYYVRSAAPSGTLIIRAKPTRQLGYPQRFSFDASPSYTPDKKVSLVSSGDAVDATLVRTAGGVPGRIVGHAPDGWRLSDLSCSKSGAGQSVALTDVTLGTADVTTAPGEVVTCTYTFDPPVTVAGLAVRVWSDLAGGAFGVTVNGDGGPRQLQAAPGGRGDAADATGADLSALTPGQYTIAIAPPAGESSAWSLSAAACNGTGLKADGLVLTIQLAINTPMDCVVRMTHRAGTLDLSAVTVGGTGTAGFSVVRRPAENDDTAIDTGSAATGIGWAAVAATSQFGAPTTAQGNVPAGLDFGSYLVTPLAPAATIDGDWRLSSFSCDPGDAAASGATGAEVVPLHVSAADAKCVATFQLVASTKLQLTLRFDGDTTGRSGDASITLHCDDGSTGAVILPAGDNTDASLPQPLAFTDPAACIIESPDAGAALTAHATTTAVLDPAPGNAPLSLPGKLDVKRDVDEYTVTVTLTYTATGEPPQQATVLDTFRILPVALIGAGLIGLGLVILLVMVFRSRGV